MPNKHKSIDLRLNLEPNDPLYDAFYKIKEASGLKSNSEVLRFILKQLSNQSNEAIIDNALSQI